MLTKTYIQKLNENNKSNNNYSDCSICIEKINKMEAVPRSVMFNVPMRYISIYIGNKRENINRLKALFYLNEVKLNPVSDYAEFELVA